MKIFKFLTKYFMSDTNTGLFNTGDRNTGHFNTGHFNTGDRNTGDRNTGHFNTGHFNTGDRNTGYFNTGDRNTGDRNTGDRNTGDFNTGHFNTGHFNTGMFNTDEPCMRMFNKQTEIKYSDFVSSDKFPLFHDFDLTVWIDESNMTEEEKKENPNYKTTGGFLKSLDYKTAWSIFWRKTSEENKRKILNLPNFDAEIFKEITGIDVNEQKFEVTMDEIADKFGFDVKQLKIKK